MNRDEYPEEVSVLSNEMMQRVEAARQARALLEKRAVRQGGIFSPPIPQPEPTDVMDVIHLASWFLTGQDPWEYLHAEGAVPVGNAFLERLREEQADFPQEYCPNPQCESPQCQRLRAADSRAAELPSKTVCQHPGTPPQAELAKLEFWGCYVCGVVVKNRAGIEATWCTGDRSFLVQIPGYGYKTLREGDQVQLVADDAGVLNWRQPDPITDAERERMTDAGAACPCLGTEPFTEEELAEQDAADHELPVALTREENGLEPLTVRPPAKPWTAETTTEHKDDERSEP